MEGEIVESQNISEIKKCIDATQRYCVEGRRILYVFKEKVTDSAWEELVVYADERNVVLREHEYVVVHI